MSEFWKRYPAAISALGVALLSIALYWPSLSLPVIYDDLLHIRIVGGMDFASAWLPTDAFGFYRPLTFVPLVIIRDLFGSFPGWLLHGLNVGQHAINVLLLMSLVRRLGWDRTRTLLAGLFFALFPFSYQAVAVYGHNVHPTTTGILLLALHTYLNASRPAGSASTDRRRQWAWWLATVVLFLLALLSHESAVLFGVFAALVHWNDRDELPDWRHRLFRLQLRPATPWLLFLLSGGLYITIYRSLSVGEGPQLAISSAADAWQSLLYLLQTAAYPLTWLAHLAPSLGTAPLVLGSTGVTALLTLWAAGRRVNRLPLLMGWAWWGLASAVIAIPLAPSYLLHGPRLLYLSSVGLSLSWAVLLTGRRDQSWLRVGLALAAGLILISNWLFVRGRLTDYDRLTAPIDQMAEIMRDRPADEGLVIVNLPQWLAPLRNTYATGSELAAMLGNYLFADEIVRENLPGSHPVYPVVVPDLLDTPDYAYGLHDETAFRGDAAATLPIRSDWAENGSQVFIVRYAESGPQADHTGGFILYGDARPVGQVGPYELVFAESSLCGDTVSAQIVWRLLGGETVPPTLSIFVQLLSADGRLLTQADGPPLGLRSDLIQMRPDWDLLDVRQLPLPAGESAGQLLVGAYDYVSGVRFPAVDTQQKALPDEAFPVPIGECRLNSQ